MNEKSSRWKRIVQYANSTEGEVEEYFSTRRGTGKICTRGKNKNTTAYDQAIINERNSEDNLRWQINSNFKKGDLHLAFTYAKENRPSLDESKSYVQKSLRKIRAYYKKIDKPFKYIWTTEIGKRGAVHHHFILEYIDLRILQKFWPHGRIRLMNMLDESGRYDALADYIIKGSRKAFEMDSCPNKKRFNSSQNLLKPKINYERVRAKKWIKDPQTNEKYMVVPGTLKQGIHGITGTPWRKYHIKFLNRRE